jgi:DNA primase large subunit
MFKQVPFEEVAELVRNRRVHLLQGQAYVPREHLASLVVGCK